MHVEPRVATFHFDLVLGPDAGLQINVTLILFRSLLSRSGEVKIRMRTVLGRVVAPDLIVGAAVGGSEIDVLVALIALEPKSDANEPASVGTGSGGRLAR